MANNALRMAQLKKRRIAKGLCPNCGKPYRDSYYSCAACRDYQHNYRLTHTKAIRTTQNRWNKSRYNRLKAHGLCVTCGDVNNTLRARCVDCLERHRLGSIKTRLNRKVAIIERYLPSK